MSLSLPEIIQEIQKKLGIESDASPGPQTWGTLHEVIVKETKPAKAAAEVKKNPEVFTASGKPVDSRSEKNIATLHPVVRPYARALVEKCAAQGFIIKVISGTRTYEEQKVLYEKYKNGGPQAAPPGYSNHNFGIAIDIGVFSGSTDPEKAKTYHGESKYYAVAGGLGKELGLSWGGDWKKSDPPHFQLRPYWAAKLSEKEMIAELRRRVEKKIDPFA